MFLKCIPELHTLHRRIVSGPMFPARQASPGNARSHTSGPLTSQLQLAGTPVRRAPAAYSWRSWFLLQLTELKANNTKHSFFTEHYDGKITGHVCFSCVVSWLRPSPTYGTSPPTGYQFTVRPKPSLLPLSQQETPLDLSCNVISRKYQCRLVWLDRNIKRTNTCLLSHSRFTWVRTLSSMACSPSTSSLSLPLDTKQHNWTKTILLKILFKCSCPAEVSGMAIPTKHTQVWCVQDKPASNQQNQNVTKEKPAAQAFACL